MSALAMSSTAPPAAIDARAFRNALGAFTTGVTIVTTRDALGRDVGLTINSFNSVSLEPPLVLWSLARSAASLTAFVEAEFFAVHILGARQEALSNLFAQRGVDKFAGMALARGHGGVPLLDGCAVRFECRTAYRHEGGDHEIFVGEVLTFEHFDTAPLVFQQGSYAVAVKKPRAGTGRMVEGSGGAPDGSFSKEALVYLLGCAHSMLRSMVRPDLRARGLSDDDYFILNVLAVGTPRAVADLDALLAYAGRHVSAAQIESLVERGLVAPAGDGPSVCLSEAGRRAMLELAAISKAAEEDALQQIDYSETHLLKHLLKRVIRNTVHGVPALWPLR
jgi:3-hydroxy-9,10-secoandrosta-1,3,5(10)-triene-9,17-dione monooxygenase reductase component